MCPRFTVNSSFAGYAEMPKTLKAPKFTSHQSSDPNHRGRRRIIHSDQGQILQMQKIGFVDT